MKILLFILLWYAVGVMVLAAVDTREEILEWFKSCPKEISWWARPLALTAWPVMVWMYYKRG